MRATRRYGASIPAALTEALQEFETAGDLLNERKRFSGKLSDRVLHLRVDGGAGIASGGESDQRGARTHPAKSQHLCRTAWARPGQVRTVESNASEPLMTCRKRRNGVKTGG